MKDVNRGVRQYKTEYLLCLLEKMKQDRSTNNAISFYISNQGDIKGYLPQENIIKDKKGNLYLQRMHFRKWERKPEWPPYWGS